MQEIPCLLPCSYYPSPYPHCPALLRSGAVNPRVELVILLLPQARVPVLHDSNMRRVGLRGSVLPLASAVWPGRNESAAMWMIICRTAGIAAEIPSDWTCRCLNIDRRIQKVGVQVLALEPLMCNNLSSRFSISVSHLSSLPSVQLSVTDNLRPPAAVSNPASPHDALHFL